MTVPERKDIETAMKPYEHDILDIVYGAWEDWREVYEVVQTIFARTRANFVHDRMVVRAHQAFSSKVGIRIIERNETFFFLVDDRVLFRFKKGDRKGLSRNVPTQMALAYHDHQQVFPGLPKIIRVDVVYVLNRLATLIDRVCIVGRDGARIEWVYEIQPSVPVVEELPLVASHKASSEDVVRLRNHDEVAETNRKEQS